MAVYLRVPQMFPARDELSSLKIYCSYFIGVGLNRGHFAESIYTSGSGSVVKKKQRQNTRNRFFSVNCPVEGNIKNGDFRIMSCFIYIGNDMAIIRPTVEIYTQSIE